MTDSKRKHRRHGHKKEISTAQNPDVIKYMALVEEMKRTKQPLGLLRKAIAFAIEIKQEEEIARLKGKDSKFEFGTKKIIGGVSVSSSADKSKSKHDRKSRKKKEEKRQKFINKMWLEQKNDIIQDKNKTEFEETSSEDDKRLTNPLPTSIFVDGNISMPFVSASSRYLRRGTKKPSMIDIIRAKLEAERREREARKKEEAKAKLAKGVPQKPGASTLREPERIKSLETIKKEKDARDADDQLKKRRPRDSMDLLTEWVDQPGLCFLNRHVAQLDTGSILVCRHHHNQEKVKILSGGRLGHEPLFMEYVGFGMLSGVVLGSLHSAPKPNTILKALLELNNGKGIVVIIRNEMEDRLNFTLAASRATELGMKVEVVTIMDDVSDQQDDKIGCRSLAGIVILFKLAGAMSLEDYTVDQIVSLLHWQCLSTVSTHLVSDHYLVGTSLDADTGTRWPKEKFNEALENMLNLLTVSQRRVEVGYSNQFALLVNFYRAQGGGSDYAITNRVLEALQQRDYRVIRLYVGTFVSSLRRGFSITVLKDWAGTLVPLLDAPCIVSAPWPSWPSMDHVPPVSPYSGQISNEPLGPLCGPEGINATRHCIRDCLRVMKQNQERWDEKEPGLGEVVRRVVWHCQRALDLQLLPLDRPRQLLLYLSQLVEEHAGHFGLLLAIFFSSGSLAFHCPADSGVRPSMWAAAFMRATDSMCGYGKLRKGRCGMADVLAQTAECLYFAPNDGNMLVYLDKVLKRLRKGGWHESENVKAGIAMELLETMYLVLRMELGHWSYSQWKDSKEEVVVIVDAGEGAKKLKKTPKFSFAETVPRPVLKLSSGTSLPDTYSSQMDFNLDAVVPKPVTNLMTDVVTSKTSQSSISPLGREDTMSDDKEKETTEPSNYGPVQSFSNIGETLDSEVERVIGYREEEDRAPQEVIKRAFELMEKMTGDKPPEDSSESVTKSHSNEESESGGSKEKESEDEEPSEEESGKPSTVTTTAEGSSVKGSKQGSKLEASSAKVTKEGSEATTDVGSGVTEGSGEVTDQEGEDEDEED